jgi:hypothetical protein
MRLHVAGPFLVAALAGSLGAQGNQCCTVDRDQTAPVILHLPASARWLAMGNAATGSRDDDVIFYNPAQVAVARGTSVSFEQYSAGTRGGTLSSVARLNTGGVAVGVNLVDYETAAGIGGFPVTRRDLLARGPQDAVGVDMVIAVAQVVKGFRVGAAGKYADDLAGERRAGGAALDLGVSKDFRRYFTAGLTVQNIGRDVSTTRLVNGQSVLAGPNPYPLQTTLGLTASKAVGIYDLLVTSAVSVERDGFVVPAGGVEVGYSWLDGYNIAVRAGARRPDVGERAITAGAGFGVDHLSIDYALEALSGSHIGHRIGLRVR